MMSTGNSAGSATLTISQLASYAGVTVRAVRHYHAKGLLPEPERDRAGYRRYDAAAVVELIRIRILAEAGVPLSRPRIRTRGTLLIYGALLHNWRSPLIAYKFGQTS